MTRFRDATASRAAFSGEPRMANGNAPRMAACQFFDLRPNKKPASQKPKGEGSFGVLHDWRV
jgi:hypothetical protein